MSKASKNVDRGAMLTMREVASKLRVHERTVYQLIRAGRLLAHKLSDRPRAHVRIFEADLASYIDSLPKA